jgi:hypothetical protein
MQAHAISVYIIHPVDPRLEEDFMPRFWEVFERSGVDASPLSASMIVPAHGANVIAVTDGGLDLAHFHHRKDIEIKKLKAGTVAELQNSLRELLGAVSANSHLSAQLFNLKPSYLCIKGRKGLGSHGTTVVAQARGRGPAAKLNVFVAPKFRVKIAFRQIMTVDEKGKFVPNSKKTCDPTLECKTINDIWNPQTNIGFDLVPASPFYFDPKVPEIRDTLARTLKLSSADASKVPAAFDPKGLAEILKPTHSGADFTIYLAHRVGTPGDDSARGLTNSERAFCIVADSRINRTMAHEIGHFLVGPKQWNGRIHPRARTPPC